MKAGQYSDPVHNLGTGDDALAVTGDYGNMSVKQLSALLSHADVSELMHPAYRFSVVLDLQDSADRLQYQQNK